MLWFNFQISLLFETGLFFFKTGINRLKRAFIFWGVVKNRGIVFWGGGGEKNNRKIRGNFPTQRPYSLYNLHGPPLICPSPYPLTLPSPLSPYYTFPTLPCAPRHILPGFNPLLQSLPGVEPLTSRSVIFHTIHLTTEYLIQIYPYFVVVITYLVSDSQMRG